ncbi:hypothetical protein ACJJTC_010149 [Scirpophaga incertulas]
MVRETRHLWVGNLPDNIREDRIREHFKRYGRVQNVKLLGRTENGSAGSTPSGVANSGVCATVAFMDIKSASKAHNAEHVLDERTLTTEYYEPAAIPSAAGAPSAGSSPAGSGYSGSSSSVNSAPAPSVSRYHLSGGEESASSACPLAATAAAPANWRGTNDSATEYCRRGNTPAAYNRYQRNNSGTPYSTPPSNVERTTPHHRWYASGERGGGATGGESTPSTPGGGTEGGRRRRHSGSGSSRSESSSPEPSDTSRASTPHAPPPQPLANANHRAPSTPTSHHQWASTANGRPLAICVRNLPARSTDTSLKDGLFHEYKKHGKVVWVKVVGQNADRYAVVRFKKPSDVEKALEVSQDKLFFGCKISVAPHQSCDEDADSAKPYETDIDEYHPKATRTLFIGNLEKDVSQQLLREKFEEFGQIIEIDIKKGSGGGAGYAFCQYATILSVVEAIRSMDGEYVGSSRVKLGFGKPVATTCVFIDGLTEHTEKQVLGAISRCGAATSVCVDRASGAALVHFEQAAAAGAAVRELRRVAAAASAAAASAAPAAPAAPAAAGTGPSATSPAPAAGTPRADHDAPRLCVDYASRECQEIFYERLEKHGGQSALSGLDRLTGEITAGRFMNASRHDSIRYDGARSRASSYGRASSRTPRYPALDHYDTTEYPADRRYRVYDEVGSSPQTEDAQIEDRLQSVVVSPHRARRHRRDSSPEDRKHSKERHRSVGGGSGVNCAVMSRRSRSGSRCGERHGAGAGAGGGGSGGARRRHRRRRDGSGSHGSRSRAGTPLRDEPDALPAEPRRPPRERPPLPMSLPLPKFAVQLLRAAPPAHRLPPAPPPAPAPDSPPRPPSASASSSSGGSAPHSPSLEERIRSLDEKYEKWSGSRALADAPDRARPSLRHRLLEVDINEVKPSEVVRSLLAKRSVFDEDSERLEGAVRAPSPNSERARGRGALHYAFPAPLTADDVPDRPADPRLNRPDRTVMKTGDTDFRLESRVRPRTPSTDRSQPDSSDRRSPRSEQDSEVADPTKAPHERRRRDSTYELHKISLETGTEVEVNRLDISDIDPRSREKCKITIPERRHSIGKIFENATEKSNVPSILTDSSLQNVEKPSESITLKSHEIKKEDERRRLVNIHDIIKSESFIIRRTKSVDDCNTNKDNANKQKSDTDGKLDSCTIQAITEELNKEIFNDNNSNKDALETQSNCLLSTIPNKDISEFSAELIKCHEKNGKERLNPNVVLEVLQSSKLLKENIALEKDKSNTHGLSEKKVIENEKSNDERSTRNEKTRHGKDRHENDKDNNRTKSTKHEKDKKVKEESGDKSDKIHKERSERDTDRSKHSDDKSRHDHHRKDKIDKDKKKDYVEDSKSKKEDKPKHEKKKESGDSKHCKKEESSKSRKSSRDESTRDFFRKDSTDSSTSRTSHDSSKLRDIDVDVKDEKLKNKHFIDFPKLEFDKDLPSKYEDLKHESLLKILSDTNDCKDSIDITIKVKQENISDFSGKSKGDIEKQRHYSLDSPSVDSKRKERLNSCSSLPSNIGHKRRMSSQDSIESLNEELKKSKCDRRESKDSRNSERHKTTKFSKGHFAKLIESKTKDDKKNIVKTCNDSCESKSSDTQSDQKISLDKHKNIKKIPLPPNSEKPQTETQNEGLHNDIDFLATLELRSSEEDEKQKALRKEMKEKKRIQQLQQIQELQMQQDALQQAELISKSKDDKKSKDDRKKDAARDKRFSTERKSREEKIDANKRKNRKHGQSTDSSDSDEPKKHSIFDIIDDGPTYISMYDKVKARSCKNMQKQEEEKRQEKIKAKFSQLKQSRAKREEKKRSSWDEDSDSEHERKKPQKTSMESSTDDENIGLYNKKREKLHSLEYDRSKSNNYINVPCSEEDLRNKLSRKNSRTRIMSDTSEDDISKRSSSKSPTFGKELLNADLPSSLSSLDASHFKLSREDKIKKTSLLNLFGKSDSEDSKLKSSIESEVEYKSIFNKTVSNDFSSESESTICNRTLGENRKKHKKKQKKHKVSISDSENKTENEGHGQDEDTRHKNSEKARRHSSKKEKRRDKIRDSIDTDEPRDEKTKIKKEKKISSSVFDLSTDCISKKDGKMEDIFGPLSDESDKDSKSSHLRKIDLPPKDYEPTASFDQIISEDGKLKDKDELKRRKDKKRKEKRYLMKEDDNSLDVDAVSKAIEARLFAEVITDDGSRGDADSLPEFIKKIEQNELKKREQKSDRHADKQRRDCREKRKKKKKNREDRQSRKDHHHFYHHERFEKSLNEESLLDMSSKEMLLNIPLPSDTPTIIVTDKSDDAKSLSESPSLPILIDSPLERNSDIDGKLCELDSPSRVSLDVSMEIDDTDSKHDDVYDIPMPPPIENIDISEVPLPKDPPKDPPIIRDNFLGTFTDDIDKSEIAVRSISNLSVEIDKQSEKIETPPLCKNDKKIEEKPRAIISQEETEDAVAALLGESFGGKVIFPDYEQVDNAASNRTESGHSQTILEEDAEEMRRAVQNLNASQMDMKPDTPVSDSDLLLIDTDNEETDETPQDAIERLPVNVIATNQPLSSSDQLKPTDASNTIIESSKATIIHVVKSDANESNLNVHIVKSDANESNVKVITTETKLSNTKPENIHHITSTATPVITSRTLTNKSLPEPQILNINKDKNENKAPHITTNILQAKSTQSTNVTSNTTIRPIIAPTRVGTPYQVINQMIRPQSPILQPPTIKIPEQHILYQKPSSIVISPRISNDPRLQSPKTTSPGEAITSPRLTNMAILSTSPQAINSVGMSSPNTIQQRSPGQVTVVRVQQPPLSPIPTMHIPHGGKTMISPNRPNSVLVQTQGPSIHFNRLPVTPVLAPISKQVNVANAIPQNKTIGVSSPVLHQQKGLPTDRRNDQRTVVDNTTENSKVILSPTSLAPSTNPTVMAQNRLISMQHAVHVGNINTSLHLGGKILLNNLNQVKENHVQKSEHVSHLPFSSTPIIHVAGVNHSSPSIIQSTNKPVILQENTIRSQGSNVIHTLNSQRLSSTPITNVIQMDPNKTSHSVVFSCVAGIRPSTVLTKLNASSPVAATTSCLTNVVMTPFILKTGTLPNTLSMNTKSDKEKIESKMDVSFSSVAVNRPSTVLTKINASNTAAATTSCLTNVVMTPFILKTGKLPLSLNAKSDQDKIDNNKIVDSAANNMNRETDKGNGLQTEETLDNEKVSKQNIFSFDSKDKHKDYFNSASSTLEAVGRCETDFEELLKDTTNEIKINKNDPEKKLEVNVGKTVTLITAQKPDRRVSIDGINKHDITKVMTEKTILDKPLLRFSEEQNIVKNTQLDKENREVVNTCSKKSSDQFFDHKDNTDTATSKETVKKDESRPGTFCNIRFNDESKDQKASNAGNIFTLASNESDSCDGQKNIDENDSWSAKDVNIDSVIKKVDSLCNDNTEFRENNKSDIVNDLNVSVFYTKELKTNEQEATKSTDEHKENPVDSNIMDTDNTEIEKTSAIKTTVGKRGGRSGRGKRQTDRVQTRQISKPVRGATSTKRGRGRAKVDKKIKSIVSSNPIPGDVYDFHEDSGDESSSNKTETRPRLILTIKSPLSGHSNATPTSTLSITHKEQVKVPEKPSKEEKPEAFVSPSPNTRKSRRLQEKDVQQKNAVDDSLDDFGKNTAKTGKKRPTRQTGPKAATTAVDTRKSPRGVKRTRDRSLSDASIDSGDERVLRREDAAPAPKTPRVDSAKVDADPKAAEVVRPTPAELARTAPADAVRPAPVLPVIQSVAQPALSQPPVVTQTPIMKPPKKMISEISLKLAGAFEAATVAGRAPMAPPELEKEKVSLPAVPEPAATATATAAAAASGGDAHGSPRRPGAGELVAVGATEAADARVQSPALPHRPPSARPADRATPILMRGGEGEGAAAGGAMGGVLGGGCAGAAAAVGPTGAAGPAGPRYRGAYAGPASLPRGAHLPHPHPHPHAIPHQQPQPQPQPHPHPLPHAKQVTVIGPHQPGAGSRVTLTSVPSISPQGQVGLGDGMYPHFSHQHYQVYQQHFRATQHENRASPLPYTSRSLEAEGCEAPAPPPLELRRPTTARVPRPAHSPAPSERLIMYAVGCGRSPPPAHGTSRLPAALPPPAAPGPPHASMVPREADSLQMLLRRYPVMWQGLLALKNDSAAVQMHFVHGNPAVAGDTLPRLADGSTPLLRVAQRMRLEPAQLDQVHRKMKTENEHCMLLALPCGRDHMDVLQQSNNLTAGFTTYLQRKQAAGIVNVAPPGHHQAMYTVHIFPSCDFANENLNRIAPDLMHRVSHIAHLLIVIATV